MIPARLRARPEDNPAWVRYLLLAVGTASLMVGLVGVVVPVLPTTPFLLLSAACYARSSRRFYDRLLGNRVFGAYIRNYREGRGLPLRIKVLTISTLWSTIAITALLFVHESWLRILLMLVAVGVTAHILIIRTYVPSPE
jgi:hypothetical protein